MNEGDENQGRPRNFSWYKKLNKPSITPPPWVFPIVWTILYILILASGFVYLRDTGYKWSKPLIFYILQWIFNLIWSPLFFWRKMVLGALIDVTLMWVFILLSIMFFYPRSHLAAYLLLPYITWVSLAWYLNLYIFLNNDFKDEQAEAKKSVKPHSQ